jgi:hypothetical protein
MAERQKKPLSVNSFSVKITIGTEAVTSFFSKCSSVEKTYNTGSYSDGESNIVYELPTSVKYSDLTLGKVFTEDDDALMQKLLSANNKVDQYVSVDIQPVYRDAYSTTAIGGTITAKYCTVKSVKLPEIDTSGDGVAMLEFVLSPGYVTSDGSKQFWKEPVATA